MAVFLFLLAPATCGAFLRHPALISSFRHFSGRHCLANSIFFNHPRPWFTAQRCKARTRTIASACMNNNSEQESILSAKFGLDGSAATGIATDTDAIRSFAEERNLKVRFEEIERNGDEEVSTSATAIQLGVAEGR